MLLLFGGRKNAQGAPVLVAAFASLSADTLVLRNGSQLSGKMTRATEHTLSFVDDTGARHEFEIQNVRSISFGEDVADTSRSRTGGNIRSANTPGDLVDHLNDQVVRAMERAGLSERQRAVLDDTRSALLRAADEARDNHKVHGREVRKALDNIRYVMSSPSISAADRRAVLEDIARLRDQYPDFAGVPEGTRR